MSVRVGIDATTWWNERGFGRFTRGLIRALCRRSGEFRYTLLVDRGLDASLPEEVDVLPVRVGRPITEAAVGSSARSLTDVWSFSRAIARADCDLLFFPTVYSYVPLLSRVPSVVAFHDTIAERYPELVFPTRRNRLLWNAKVRLARFQASRVITVSRASARDIESILGVERGRIDIVSEAAHPYFRVLDDPAPAEAVRRRYGIDPNVPLLVYVGGLNPHKNLLGLLYALQGVLTLHPTTQLAVVGDTSGRGFFDNVSELRRFVASHPPLDACVRFTGYVADEDLVALLNGATALVLPSLWEGFGLPALEAMACGLPVVASDRGSLPEVIGEAGLLFDPESPEEMARVIDRVLGEPALQVRLAERALARAATFTWEAAADLTETSFRRALGAAKAH